MEQLEFDTRSRLEKQFDIFDAENPHVYELFKRFTFEAINSGFKHYNSRSVLERVRWHTDVETTDGTFKINNNHQPYYARKFMREFPKHEGFFRTRSVS